MKKRKKQEELARINKDAILRAHVANPILVIPHFIRM